MDVSGNLLVLCLSESQSQSFMDSESRRRRARSPFDKSRQDIIEALGLFSLHDFLQPFPNNFANGDSLRRRHFNQPLICYKIQNISVGRTFRTLGIFDSSQAHSLYDHIMFVPGQDQLTPPQGKWKQTSSSKLDRQFLIRGIGKKVVL